MKGRFGVSLSLAALALLAAAAVALAAYPWKNKVFAANVRGKVVSLKVAKNGKSATVLLASEPIFCSNAGGFSPVKEQVRSAPISKKGAFSDTITYKTLASVFGPAGKLDGHVKITGTFSKTSFKGTLQTTFAKGTFCNGKTSFTALHGAL